MIISRDTETYNKTSIYNGGFYMRKRLTLDGEKRLFNLGELRAYTGMGETKAKQFAEEIGAVRRFGRSVRYDRATIDAALDKAQA